MATISKQQLFGGAIECDLPTTYEDVSLLREIPDNEEVFHEPSTDACLVVDILQFSADVPDDAIAAFQFDDIAAANEVKSFQIEDRGLADSKGGQRFLWCGGVQTGIVKFRERETRGNDVYVWVGVCRLKEYDTDVVVSVSAPIRISEASSSHKLGSVPDVARGKAVFESVLSSFKIKDFGLFA